MKSSSTPKHGMTTYCRAHGFGTAPFGVWLALLFMFLGFSASAAAQLDTGAISGTVLDPANKVVQGAQVSIRGTETGTAYSTVSSSTGYYVFPSVRTGNYDITVAANGFKTAIHKGVVVAVGATSSQDIALAVGSTNEMVTVSAGAETLQTDTSDMGVSVQPEQVENLPLTVNGCRSLETLITLAPGVVSYGMAAATDPIKINGGQEAGTDFLIDGITTNRQQNGSGSFGIISPSVDAVSEFHITLSGLPAELGRTTGGISNFNTKGGTNDFHGTAYVFAKNASFDANSWFSNGEMAEQENLCTGSDATQCIENAKAQFKRPADTKYDYGINLGGPVHIPHLYKGKDKSFFFFNWEQWRQTYGGAITSILPTPAMLGSDGQYFDFSSTLGGQIPGVTANDNACTQTLYFGEIFDPQYVTTGSGNAYPCRSIAFPNNQIPINRASTIAQNIVTKYLMPLAKQEVAGSNTYNYVQRSEGIIDNTAYSIRIDQNLGARNKIWAFWSSRENTDSGGNSNLPVPFQTCCGTVDQLGKLIRGGWDWIVTPTLVNSFTFGGNRSNNINKSKASQMGTDWDKQLGIANGFSNDFPVFEFYGNSFGGIGQQEDSTDIDNVVAVNDILHWQHGAHSIKVGIDAQYHQYSWVSHIGGTCSGNAGCIEFWDNQTASDTHFWGSDGNSFAAFLVGETGDMNNLNDLHAPRWITHYGAIFAQDDWKVKPNLTINLGMRWSYETPRREAAGDTAIWDPTKVDAAATPGYYGPQLGALVFAGKGAGRNGSQNETWGSVYRKNFEPRVGFSWEPDVLNHKDVIHGSVGIYYGPLVEADYGQGTVQGFTVQGDLSTPGEPLGGYPLDGGLPVLPTTPNLGPNQLDGTNIAADYVAKSNGRPGMMESWTLEMQHQITPNLTLSAGYLGMHATHLHAMLNYMNDMPDKYMALGDYLGWWAYYPPNLDIGVNQVNSIEPYANFSCATGCTWPISEPISQALRPFPQIGYINMDSYLQNLGQSTYNALEAKLEQHFHNGLNILASYTFSKTLTDADVIQPYWSTLQNGGAVQDPENLRGEKAVSSEDVPHNFVVSYTYELPVGEGKTFFGNTPKPISMVISHWSVNGIQHYVSGQPISIFGATGIPGKNSSVRYDRVPGQPVKNPHYKNPLAFQPGTTGSNPTDPNSLACETGYFNCNAFYDPNYITNRDPAGSPAGGNPYRFGTMPRNSSDIRGFGYLTEDFGISKVIPIHGNIKANFRAEMFDAFNRHIFLRPNSAVGTTTVGSLASGTTSNIDAGQIGGLQNGPRNVQFRLNITY